MTRKEMSFEEQIMFKDKYTSTFSRRIEANMFLNQSNILQRVKKMFTNSSLFSAWDVFLWVFSDTTLCKLEIFPGMKHAIECFLSYHWSNSKRDYATLLFLILMSV